MKTPVKLYMQALAVEVAVCAAIVIAIWWFDPALTVSVAAGCLVFILPSAYFTFSALPRPYQGGSSWFVVSFFKGQIGKLALTAVGFALVFRFVSPLHVPSFFVVYSVLLLIHVVVVAGWQNAVGRK
jgi:ATP synthase protein I